MRQDARWLADIVVAEDRPFQVWDATIYTGKSDLTVHGIKPLPVVKDIWAQGVAKTEAADKTKVQSAMAVHETAGTEAVYFDVENWPVNTDDDTAWGSVEKYVNVLQWAHAAAPSVDVGFYARPPYRSYWGVLAPTSQEALDWPGWNDRMKALAGETDTLYPSLYTFYDDQPGWVKYADGNIAEARRLSPTKPIAPFLWPEYHNSNQTLQFQYVGDTYWRLQLETVANRTNAVVIWGGWDFAGWQAKVWDDDVPWFVELLDFLNDVDQ